MAELENLNQDIKVLRARLDDYEKLFKIFKSVSSSLETEEILELIISEAVDLSRADQGSIILFDPDKKQLTKTLIHSENSKTGKIDTYLNNLLAGWVQDNGNTLLTSDLIRHFGVKLIKQKYNNISSVLSIPIKKKQKILGVINLISYENKFQFTEKEMQLVDILTSQCVHIIVNARIHESLFKETNRLRRELESKYTFSGVIGNSPKLMEVFSLLERIIPTDARVMIEGESGTGKELIARILHYNGPNKEGPFVAVDCAAFPENLLESELFGYVKGAFTGAIQDKQGLFEEAHNGTLFLDEITNMPTSIQSKLLRVLQENEIRPVGSTRLRKVKVRIISAASDSLKERLKSGKFREDLYYRLSVINVNLPPLRERLIDISLLTNYFLKKYSDKYNKHVTGLKSETLKLMELYNWPGNIRQLENAMERIVILAEPDMEYIPCDLLPEEILSKKARSSSEYNRPLKGDKLNISEKKTEYEKNIITDALTQNNWNQSATANELGIHESTLRYKMRKFGILKR